MLKLQIGECVRLHLTRAPLYERTGDGTGRVTTKTAKIVKVIEDGDYIVYAGPKLSQVGRLTLLGGAASIYFSGRIRSYVEDVGRVACPRSKR